MTRAVEGLGYAVNDLAGTITEITTAYANALGFSPAELIGRHFRDIVAPEKCAEAERCFAHVLEKGADTVRAVYVVSDGSRIAMNVSLMPVRDLEGHVVSMLIVPQANSLTPLLKRGSDHLMADRGTSARTIEPRGIL